MRKKTLLLPNKRTAVDPNQLQERASHHRAVLGATRHKSTYVNILNCELSAVLYVSGMANYAFVYRCPATGRNVQGFVHAPAADDPNTYETVTCTACYRVHLVNPVTRHVAGSNSPNAAP